MSSFKNRIAGKPDGLAYQIVSRNIFKEAL
jgi:hypothetical protein